MIITYGRYRIAAGGSEGPDGLRLSQSRAVQTVDYVGSVETAGGIFARGNYRHDLTFAVTRTRDSLRGAAAEIFDHPGSLPDTDTLAIEEREAGGVLRRWVADAVLVRVEMLEQTGTTTRWGYQFLLGPIATKNPDLES